MIETGGLGIQTNVQNDLNAYAYIDATSGTPIIQKAMNVSSITDGGEGIFTVNFTSALASTNYSAAGMSEKTTGGPQPDIVYEKGDVARTTTAMAIRVSSAVSYPRDEKFSIIVVGA